MFLAKGEIRSNKRCLSSFSLGEETNIQVMPTLKKVTVELDADDSLNKIYYAIFRTLGQMKEIKLYCGDDIT